MTEKPMTTGRLEEIRSNLKNHYKYGGSRPTPERSYIKDISDLLSEVDRLRDIIKTLQADSGELNIRIAGLEAERDHYREASERERAMRHD